MRIALVNHTATESGGLEVYLRHLALALEEKGHELAILTETTGSLFSECKAQHWTATPVGVRKLREWGPDVISTHTIENPTVLRALLGIAPITWSVHNYEYVCVSATKHHKSPWHHNCHSPFGIGCAIKYFPLRCGGLSPETFLNRWRRVQRFHALLPRFSKIIVHAEAVKRMLLKEKISQSKLVKVPFGLDLHSSSGIIKPQKPLRLIFVGRTVAMKGGDIFIEAMKLIDKDVGQKIFVEFAGDGAALPKWKSLAKKARFQNFVLNFHGWLSEDSKHDLLKRSHLHVLPSVWPEPYGLSGQEAAKLGLPTLAFRVGGIPEWIRHEENGILVSPGINPAHNLSKALFRLVKSPPKIATLGIAAKREADAFQFDSHVQALELQWQELFNQNASKRSA